VSAAAADSPLLLVVDDDPINVELLCDLLEALDYRVAGALGGEAALLAARERKPDLVLLDVMMPGMNGYEVCRRLKADPATSGIPVVFVTALSDSEDKVEAIEAGGDDFLTKPFNRSILVARVRSLLRLKAANDQLDRQYRKLRELEELRDDLTRMVVHDLKSPLSAMLGTLEMAVDGDLGVLTEPQQRLFADAHQRGADVLLLIDNLLDLSRLEESRLHLEPRDVPVRALLDETAAQWAVRAEQAGSSVSVDAEPDLAVHADGALLRRVLANLVGNALKHAGPGVRIRLTGESSGEGVELAVADDGAGIDPQYHEEIFRKWGSARPRGDSAGSSGLGLTFCKLAVETHGGRIWVRSAPGEGSEFHIFLPAAVPSSIPAAEPLSAAAS
jgi:signal transduction histidine kinase